MPEQEETIPGQLAEIRSRLDKGDQRFEKLGGARGGEHRRSPGHSRRADGRARLPPPMSSKWLGGLALAISAIWAARHQVSNGGQPPIPPIAQEHCMDKQQLQANIARLPFNYSTYVAMAICYAFDWWMDPANAADRRRAHPAVPVPAEARRADLVRRMGARACVADDCAGTGASTGPPGTPPTRPRCPTGECRCVCRWRRPSRS